MTRQLSIMVGKSGSGKYRGKACFDPRNETTGKATIRVCRSETCPLVLPGQKKPAAGTHKGLLFRGGFERWLQNQGTSKKTLPQVRSLERKGQRA
jgi:hypothetical protein